MLLNFATSSTCFSTAHLSVQFPVKNVEKYDEPSSVTPKLIEHPLKRS